MRRLAVIAGIAAVLTACGGAPKSPVTTLSATTTIAKTSHTYVLKASSRAARAFTAQGLSVRRKAPGLLLHEDGSQPDRPVGFLGREDGDREDQRNARLGRRPLA